VNLVIFAQKPVAALHPVVARETIWLCAFGPAVLDNCTSLS